MRAAGSSGGLQAVADALGFRGGIEKITVHTLLVVVAVLRPIEFEVAIAVFIEIADDVHRYPITLTARPERVIDLSPAVSVAVAFGPRTEVRPCRG